MPMIKHELTVAGSKTLQECACTGKSLARIVHPAVLAVLADEPLHGYLIVQRLMELKMFREHAPDAAGVYRVLRTMEAEGLVTATWNLGEAGPAKRCFQLTPSGRACMERWIPTLEEYANSIEDLVAAIQKRKNYERPGTWSKSMTASSMASDEAIGAIDSLDLKYLLITHGVHLQEEVHQVFGATHRISRDPYECNCLLLPNRMAVHIADLGPEAAFHLAVGPEKSLELRRRGEFVTEVFLPEKSGFYQQTTSRGTPFRGLGFLEGRDTLAFAYLWACAYTTPGMACKFCHCGVFTEQQRASGDERWNYTVKAEDVAEAIEYAVRREGTARHVELTGGSTFAAHGECRQMAEVLRSIDQAVGLKTIPAGTNIYTTPPQEPKAIDELFEAGADRVSCNLEVWDEAQARQMVAGKAKWTGRQRHLDTLLHIARTQGPNKACCTFVIGMEPAESVLAGAEYLAAQGVVPLASVLMPHGLPEIPGVVKADLGFFRTVKRGLAAIYEKYQCEPPGEGGTNVSISRDVWNHRGEILG
jgi:DNA-binding PadR family transcriptional regulator